MDFQSMFQRIDFCDRQTLYIALTAPIIAYSGVKLLSSLLTPTIGNSSNILVSPRQSLQLLSAQKFEDLPYPPTALPGARDVDTPYGNIRVYEWGPESGAKVLLVHGISTPCIAFAGVAKLLVERGCRVMLFDLFGRGYSDAPDPALFPQDIKLFTTQILLVLASSKLAWTGSGNRFTMVGYSLGGGISAAFTSYFPDLVESLVLVAPSGLLRPSHSTTSSKLMYGNLLPPALVNYYVAGRLRGTPSTKAGSGNPEATSAVNAAESEVPSSTHPAHAANSTASMFPNRPGISPANTVAWQVDAHPGFLAAFISSIKHAPISSEHERWKRIGSRQAARRASVDPEAVSGLKEGKVLVLLGEQDSVIVADEVEEDATEALGRGNVEIVRLEGGHDLPIVNAKGCVDAIVTFCSLGGG